MWAYNKMHDNWQYGFDPHDDSDYLTIAYNEVYNNVNHGAYSRPASSWIGWACWFGFVLVWGSTFLVQQRLDCSEPTGVARFLRTGRYDHPTFFA